MGGTPGTPTAARRSLMLVLVLALALYVPLVVVLMEVTQLTRELSHSINTSSLQCEAVAKEALEEEQQLCITPFGTEKSRTCLSLKITKEPKTIESDT